MHIYMHVFEREKMVKGVHVDPKNVLFYFFELLQTQFVKNLDLFGPVPFCSELV